MKSLILTTFTWAILIATPVFAVDWGLPTTTVPTNPTTDTSQPPAGNPGPTDTDQPPPPPTGHDTPVVPDSSTPTDNDTPNPGQPPIQQTPEPGTFLMLVLGVGTAAAVGRRKQR